MEEGQADDLANLENEVKHLRQRKATLLQEKAGRDEERREKLLAELRDLRKSVADLHNQSDGTTSDTSHQSLNSVYWISVVRQIKWLLFTCPPILLLVICANNTPSVDNLYLYAVFMVYMYGVSCYVECRVNNELRAPFSMTMFVSAVVTSFPYGVRSGSIWHGMANSYAKITVAVSSWLVLEHIIRSVTESGLVYLKHLGYVVLYGAFVGTVCELYWGHTHINLVGRNVLICAFYAIMSYCVVTRFNKHHSLLFMLRACVVYAIVCDIAYPYMQEEPHQDRKQQRKTEPVYSPPRILELNYDQSIIETIICLEIIGPVFSLIPMAVYDYISTSGNPRIPPIYILVYGAVAVLYTYITHLLYTIIVIDKVDVALCKHSLCGFRVFIWFLTNYCIETYMVKDINFTYNFRKALIVFSILFLFPFLEGYSVTSVLRYTPLVLLLFLSPLYLAVLEFVRTGLNMFILLLNRCAAFLT